MLSSCLCHHWSSPVTFSRPSPAFLPHTLNLTVCLSPSFSLSFCATHLLPISTFHNSSSIQATFTFTTSVQAPGGPALISFIAGVQFCQDRPSESTTKHLSVFCLSIIMFILSDDLSLLSCVEIQESKYLLTKLLICKNLLEFWNHFLQCFK